MARRGTLIRAARPGLGFVHEKEIRQRKPALPETAKRIVASLRPLLESSLGFGSRRTSALLVSLAKRSGLTKKQRFVVLGALNGLSKPELAKILQISPHGVAELEKRAVRNMERALARKVGK